MANTNQWRRRLYTFFSRWMPRSTELSDSDRPRPPRLGPVPRSGRTGRRQSADRPATKSKSTPTVTEALRRRWRRARSRSNDRAAGDVVAVLGRVLVSGKRQAYYHDADGKTATRWLPATGDQRRRPRSARRRGHARPSTYNRRDHRRRGLRRARALGEDDRVVEQA